MGGNIAHRLDRLEASVIGNTTDPLRIIVSFIQPGTMETTGVRLMSPGAPIGEGKTFNRLSGESRDELLRRAYAEMGWSNDDGN